MSRRFWTTWPLLCLLVCLFVFSVAAPRVWRRSAAEQDMPPLTEPAIAAAPSAPALEQFTLPEDPPFAPISGSDLMSGSVGTHSNQPMSIEEPESLGDVRLSPGFVSCPAEPDVAVDSPSPAAAEQAPALNPAAAATEPVQQLPETVALETTPAEVLEEVPEAIWPKPEALLARLDELAWDCETGLWAREVAYQVRKLGRAVAADSDEALMIVAQLNEMAREADALVAELDRDASPLAGKLRRTQHAMGRRLDVWRRVILAGGPNRNRPAPLDTERLAACVTRIDNLLGDSDAGKPWREYLQLSALGRIVGAADVDFDLDAARQLARTVVRRLTRTGLSPAQQEFLAEKPIAELAATLRQWVEGPIDLAAVLRHAEQVERNGLASDARLLMDDGHQLARSPLAEHRGLAERIELHYQNANLRVAVTEDLLNRMMPEREPEFRYVHEEVGGRPVHGQSTTSTTVAVKLIPDSRRLRMALEIEGLVSSLTASTAGPATFYNDSASTYAARKEIELTTAGLFLRPADVEVYSDLRLRDLKTDFDLIPLVGSLVKGIARSQHEQSRPTMSREVERKVATRAQQQIDGEADARLTRVSERLRTRVVEPLAAMSLGPTMVSAQTSEVRMTARVRLGGEDQVGGWTPRPQAPADSLVSFQVHESAMNNFLERLELDGGTFTLVEVRQRIAQRLNRPEMLKTTSENDDVKIRFAAKDAARVQCQDGGVCVVLSIASLSRSPHRWKNFQVRAFYRPRISGVSAELVRDGVIRLSGERLNTGAQIALRGVFSKTFSKENTWALRPEQFASNPRMAKMGVTQCVIEDGWIGLAYGPVRGGALPVMATRPGEPDRQ